MVSKNILPFLMVVTRIGIVFFTIPPFRNRSLAPFLKVLISLALAIIIFPVISVEIDIRAMTYFEIFTHIAAEFLVGLLLSFMIAIIFIAAQFAGSLIDINSGFGFASVINPLTQDNVTLTSNLYFIIAAVLFFTIGGHNLVIGAIAESYRVMPIAEFKLNQQSIQLLIRAFADISTIGFKIAAPVVSTLFLSEIALAILARSVPQMHVFIIGFSLKISVLFIIISITLINTVPYLQGLFEDSFFNLKNIITVFKA